MLSGWKLCGTAGKKDELCGQRKESSVCSSSAAGGSGKRERTKRTGRTVFTPSFLKVKTHFMYCKNTRKREEG